MPDTIAFGPFRLDLGAGRLQNGDRDVELQPRPLALLRHLAARPGVLVSRAELLASVWHDVHVSGGVVKVAMRAVREALDDDVAAPRYIETVGRRGYRFVDGTPGAAPVHPPRPPVPPVVGRRAELAALAAHLERACGGRRQTVFVSGEAGIGKTTLVDRFLAGAAARKRAWVARGQSQQHYGAGEAYLPIHDALRQMCSGPDAGDAVAILRRCAPSWLAQQAGLTSEEERATLHRTLHGATQERLLRELSEAIEVLSAARPVVLVLEDLHWSDASTIELLVRLAQRRNDAQLLVLGTYRSTEPDLAAHPLSDATRELAAKRLCTELALALLDEGEVAAFVAPCVGEGPAVALGRAVHRWTGGNPLFMVNVVDALWTEGAVTLDAGAWSLRVDPDQVAQTTPTALRGLIDKHLERLSPEVRAVLEAASVVGAVFTAEAAAAALGTAAGTVDETCQSLGRIGHLVEAVGCAAWPDGTLTGQYRFRHALYVDALRRRIAPTRLARMHRAIAERTEAGFGARAGEHAALLAAHFAAGHRRDKAERYHDLAGDAAVRQSAHREALEHYQRALDHLAARPHRGRELALHTKIGMSLAATRGYTAPEAEQAFARALALSDGLRGRVDLFPVYRGLREYHQVRGEISRARAFAERLARLAASRDDVLLATEAQFSMGSVAFYAGDLLEARRRFERALGCADVAAAVDPSGHTHDPIATTLSELALTLWLLGDPTAARARSAEAVALAESRAHPLGWAHALSFDGVLHQPLGEIAVVRARAAAVRALATEHGFPHWYAMSLLLEGWARVADGEAGGAELLRDGIAATEAIGARLGLSYWRVALARALGATGRAAEGVGVVEAELVRIEEGGERAHESALHRARGELLLLAEGDGGRAAAETCFERALTVARDREARVYALSAAVALADLWRGGVRAREGRSAVERALAGFPAGAVMPEVDRARRLLAERT